MTGKRLPDIIGPMESYASFGRAALVVDASGEITEELRPSLAARGFKLFAATSVLEALRILSAIELDVILCDLERFGLSRASFETAVQYAQPSLAGRCLFIAPQGAPRESRDASLCHRPFDIAEILSGLSNLAAPSTACHAAVS